MKNITLLSLISLLIAACTSAPKLSPEEAAKFSTKGFEIIYDGKAVAKYANKEYEYSKGKFQFEFSVEQYDPSNMELTQKMAKYLASQHPDSKIEIKLMNEPQN